MKTELTDEQLAEVKAWKPEWFKPKLQTDKWYVSETGIPTILYRTGDHDNCGIMNGKWQKYLWCTSPIDWREATDEEISQALIKEARKRGYKAGVETVYGTIKGDWGTEFNCIGLTLRCHNILIFNSGVWTDILPPSSNIHTDIQALKDKYTDYSWTIIAEKR